MTEKPRYARELWRAPIRRGIISLFIAWVVVGAFYAVLLTLTWFYPRAKDRYEEGAKNIGFVPNTAKKLPWGFWGLATVACGFTAVIWRWRGSSRLDFLLFSPFDDATLEPVTRYTGMFAWHLPEKGPLRNTWDGLRSWAYQSAELRDDRSWIRRLWRPAKTPERFSWTILVGGNGVGKTQIAKELARSLGRRTLFGNAAPPQSRLSVWRTAGSRVRDRWRLVTRHTVADVPWDAGMVGRRGERKDQRRLERLKTWFPRAPTLLILDDPPAQTGVRVIETLAGNQDAFRYPVRLLIVDQFFSGDLPITSNTDRPGWHHDDSASTPFSPFSLPIPEFGLADFRAVLAKGFWIEGADGKLALEGDLPALYRSEDIEHLVKAVDGHPVLLALAVHWLRRPRRTVDALLRADVDLAEEERDLLGEATSDLRTLVVHRLVTERIEELYDSLRPLEKWEDKAALRKSIACATVADGISPKAASEYFKLRAEAGDLQHVFIDVEIVAEDAAEDGADLLPPIRPWWIGERFVHKVERDVFPGDREALDGLIRTAWLAHPSGTLKALSHAGRLSERVARVIAATSPPERPEAKLEQFWAFAQRALLNASLSVTHAAALAPGIDERSVLTALKRLEKFIELNARVDAGTACSLYCELAARRLELGIATSEMRNAVLARLDVLVRRMSEGEIGRSPEAQTIETSFYRLATAMLRSLVVVPDREATDVEIDAITCFVLDNLGTEPSRAWSLASSEVAVERRDDRFEVLARLALAKSLRDSSDVTTCETIASDIERIVVAASWPPVQAALACARGWRLVAMAATHVPCRSESVAGMRVLEGYPKSVLQARPHVEAALGKLERIAARWPDSPDLKSAWTEALSDLPKAYHGTPEFGAMSEQVTSTIERIVEDFPGHRGLQRSRAYAWSRLAYFGIPALAAEVARRVDTVAAGFPDDSKIQLARVVACFRLIDVLTEPPSGVAKLGETIAVVEGIAGHFPRDCAIQLWRAATWNLLVSFAANAGDDGCSEVEGIVRNWHARLSDSTPPFRAASQGQPTSAAEVAEGAARIVDMTAALFPNDPELQIERAWAWRSVALARSNTPAKREGTEAIARVVDQISISLPLNADIQRTRADVWQIVALARCQMPVWYSRSENAAGAVDHIARRFPGDIAMARHRASAWLWVAWARSRMSDQWAQTEDAARIVDTIAEGFAGDADIQSCRAQAWRVVVNGYGNAIVSARGDAKEHVSRAEQAASMVDTIAAPFTADAKLQGERATAWQLISWCRANVPSLRARAEDAARMVDDIAEPFPHSRSIQGDRAIAWEFVTFARCKTPELRSQTEMAAEVVQSIVGHFPKDRGMEDIRSRVWKLVAEAWEALGDRERSLAATSRTISREGWS